MTDWSKLLGTSLCYGFRRRKRTATLTDSRLKARNKGAPKKKSGPPGKPFHDPQQTTVTDHNSCRREIQEEIGCPPMLDTFAQYHYLLGMDMYSVQNFILFNNTMYLAAPNDVRCLLG